jgi:5-methyltetrahydrofolate--homocysteine methyltransferase
MVGGAPITEKYARDIGADGYAPEAASAVEKARELIGQG